MKIRADFLLFLFLLIPFFVKAQLEDTINHNLCFTDQLHDQMLNEHPEYAFRHQLIEEQIYHSKAQSAISDLVQRSTYQTIPVVVHIVHDNGPENIPDEQVIDAIQYLNETFSNSSYYDPTTGVNVEIGFCLVTRDPQNNPSNGITRIESELTNLTAETQDLDLKTPTQWNPLDYLNIWVVNEVTSLIVGSGAVAYAYFPAAHGLPQDGIVIESSYFGTTRDSTKVLAHEAGHYLGLYHTFSGGCANDDCLQDGDRICDTPPDQSKIRIECEETINTCTTDEADTSTNNPFRPITLGGIGDQNDMHINYMDYSYFPCYSAFTEGQKDRMNTVLSTTRESLLESYGCIEPCPLPTFEAAFSSSITSPVFAGEEIVFTNNSDPADCYEWSVDGQVFGNDMNSHYTFYEDGFYTVNLLITDTINFCKSNADQVIEVVCEGTASFVTDSTVIFDGVTTMYFTNTSTPHDSYEWYLDGVLYSTDTNIHISFTEPGYYSLNLVGTNFNCLNYAIPIEIDILGCSGPDYNRENHWYFGEYGGLDFNNGDPAPISTSNMFTYQGSAAISDDDGNLLFYTDGFSVWDTTNTVMPNGANLQLPPEDGYLLSNGIWAPIIPRPYHPTQYYIFSRDYIDPNSGQYEIRYSIVDMALNGGLGDVTDVKDVYLGASNGYTTNAAYHADGEKVWLVQRSDPKVLSAYLIDSTGINPPIDFSDINDTEDTTFGLGTFFNSGKKIIFKRFNYSNGDRHLVIFDFDNTTGTLSNSIAFLPFENEDYNVLDFVLSPDDRKLYTINTEGDLNEEAINQAALTQFYLPLAINNQVASSRTRIKKMTHLNSLGLGPDGKIYVSILDENHNGGVFDPPHRQYMGVINDPNKSGMDCNYVHNSFSILPGSSWSDLPKFIKGKSFILGVHEPILDLGPDLEICDGAVTILNPEGDEKFHYLWQDSSTDPSYTAWLPGTYSVTVSNECGAVTDEINIRIDSSLLDLGPDIISTHSVVTLHAGDFWDNYLWQDGSTDSRLIVREPGEYSVYTTTEEGCFARDTINVYFDIPTNLFNSNLILYPNPSSGLFILEEQWEGTINNIDLTIYDPLGRKLYEQSSLLEGQMELDLTNYPSGGYFLHWSSFRNGGVFKLIIVND